MCVCVCVVSTWVRDHDDDAVWGVFDDLRDDAFKDVDIPLNQIQPALSFLLTYARRYHDDARVSRHRVVWPRETSEQVYNISKDNVTNKIEKRHLTCRGWPSWLSGYLVSHCYRLTFACDYLGCFKEEAAVLQIHNLSLQLVFHHVHQCQLIS